MEELIEYYNQTRDKINYINGKFQGAISSQNLINKKINQIKIESETLLKTQKYFSTCIEECSDKLFGRISNLVTNGIREIFDDDTLEFKIIHKIKRDRSFLDLRVLKNGEEFPIIGSFGGGLISIISIILRCISLENLKLRKLLVLDEPFSHLDDDRVPATALFIRKLCEELNIDILLITHKVGFIEHAHKKYNLMSNKEGFLVKRN